MVMTSIFFFGTLVRFGCLDSTTHYVDVSYVKATINPSARGCIGATFPLSASGGSSYSWSGPNGFSSIDPNPDVEEGINLLVLKEKATVGMALLCDVYLP